LALSSWRNCGVAAQPVTMLALTTTGTVEALDPTTLRVTARIAMSALPRFGVAIRPELDAGYVTSDGPDGQPAIWELPFTGCRPRPVMVEADAELPSVSPDGGYLGFITLNGDGRQTGVGVVALSAGGFPVGAVRRYPATAVPPPLPITGLAVGRDDAELAVWGGFVDSYLGSKRPTVGTLDPATATSLAALTPVFDAEGVSEPATVAKADPKPEDWQSSPVYLPDGYLLVNDHSQTISLPYRDTAVGEIGGGIRTIVRTVGPIVSMATGTSGSVAFVRRDGRLSVAVSAVDLPFGPAASTPPAPTPRQESASGRFTAVAWTEGPAAENTALPAVFHPVADLPSVVGLSESDATSVLNGLGLPVVVAQTVADPIVASGTVLSQDPPAGDGVACQCSIGLTVSKS
jgi:PASTA domain